VFPMWPVVLGLGIVPMPRVSVSIVFRASGRSLRAALALPLLAARIAASTRVIVAVSF
jgi:hypothetical protein